jgi:hydrogenase maturation protease
MNLSLVERIANAVLYEGYILYPYRPSAVKNRQRWNFGALCPPSYSEAQGGTEACVMQTQCLVQGSDDTMLDVKVRFLHLLERQIGELAQPVTEFDESIEPDFRAVASLEVNGRLFQTWQEATERDVGISGLKLGGVVEQARRITFNLPSSRTIEPLRDEGTDKIVGLVVRRQQGIEGAIEVTAERVAKDAFKLSVLILNLTSLEDAGQKSRDEALMRSFVSTHTILCAREGEFVSLLDPPERFAEAAALCHHTGTYPVLVGEEGTRDCMLSSPIILYDYPQIAPESAGELFDGTEIDEILTLRIMTLTDEEKREMRGADERARRILERTELLPAEQLMKMHGAMKSLRPKERG